MNDHDSRVLARASQAYQAVAELPVLPEIRTSGLWHEHIRKVLSDACKVSTLAELVRDVTANDRFSLPRKNDDPEFNDIIRKYLAWFERQGLPLSSWDTLLQESHLADPTVTVEREGRCLSTVFLYHLATAHRVATALGGRNTRARILELGGGHGGLARVAKLYMPETSHFILDLPESLWFSYCFVSANFPEARTIYCTTVAEVKTAEGYDFVFVPTALISGLFGSTFDMFINTASLGEMTDAAAGRYMRLVHEDLKVRFLYSNNRYGQLRHTARYQGTRLATADMAKAPLRLDPFWRIQLWNLQLDNFVLYEPHAPPSVEVLAERVPSKLLPEGYRKELSERLLREANLMPQLDAHWEFLVWESVRLHPSVANLVPYLEFLARMGYVEFHSYRHDLERISGHRVLGPGET